MIADYKPHVIAIYHVAQYIIACGCFFGEWFDKISSSTKRV